VFSPFGFVCFSWEIKVEKQTEESKGKHQQNGQWKDRVCFWFLFIHLFVFPSATFLGLFFYEKWWLKGKTDEWKETDNRKHASLSQPPPTV